MTAYIYDSKQLNQLKREAAKVLKLYETVLQSNVVKRITASNIYYDVRLGDHELVYEDRNTPHGRWHFISITFHGNTDSFAEQEARLFLAGYLEAVVNGKHFEANLTFKYGDTGKDILAAAQRLVKEFAKN